MWRGNLKPYHMKNNGKIENVGPAGEKPLGKENEQIALNSLM